MGICNSILIGIEKLPSEEKNPRHICADVVFIDKSQQALQSVLYQLKVAEFKLIDNLESLKTTSFTQDPFMMVGEILSLNESRKMITLQDGSTVSYNHLITAVGDKRHVVGTFKDNAFSTGLQTLIEAIRFRTKIVPKISLPICEIMLSEKISLSVAGHPSNSPAIDQCMAHTLSDSEKTSLPAPLSGIDKRIYKVQL